MLFNELARIFSDDDNQRRTREVLNRVGSYILYWLLLRISQLFGYLLNFINLMNCDICFSLASS